MRPFNLEAAKRGEPIITRKGDVVKFIGHFPEHEAPFRLYTTSSKNSGLIPYYEDGRLMDKLENELDLFMAPKNRILWANFYDYGQAAWFKTEEEANAFVMLSCSRIGGKAFKIEIEE